MSASPDDAASLSGPPGIDPAALHRPGGSVDDTTQLALFRQMVRMRKFETRAYDLFMENLVKGTSHLSLGQEAIAAAFGEAMDENDYTFATYRGHAHTLARGTSMTGVMGELLGRSCGVLAGKGGSMHLTDVRHGVMGSYAIVGAHLTIALGAAWSAQYRGDPRVAVAFFGDGTTNIVSLSWLHQQIIPASYHAMKVSFAMVGLIAIYVFYRAAARFLGREDIRVLYLVALFPGSLFWSSILGKDPVILLGISLYIYGVVALNTYRGRDLKRLTYLISLAAGVALASFIRFWLGPILLAPLVVFVLFGLLIVFSQSSAVAPFIYTLF